MLFARNCREGNLCMSQLNNMLNYIYFGWAIKHFLCVYLSINEMYIAKAYVLKDNQNRLEARPIYIYIYIQQKA